MKRRWPGAEHFSPDWNKRQLINLYEDLDFVGNEEGVTQGLEYSPTFLRFRRLPPQVKTTCQSFIEHRSHQGKELCEANEVCVDSYLQWSTEVEELTRDTDEFPGQATRHNFNIKIKQAFKNINWWFPLLLGSQHNNRFKRDTKVFVLSGLHKGRHGTVVGHGVGFEINRWGSEIETHPHYFEDNRSPLLKILFICPERGVEEILDIRQDIVKLADLFNLLAFGLPVKSPVDPKVKNNYLDTIARRKSLRSYTDRA